MNGAPERSCAVVYDQIKVSDDLREAITRHARTTGWGEPLWLETTTDQPSRPTTDELVSAEVDRVIAAGGDGTSVWLRIDWHNPASRWPSCR